VVVVYRPSVTAPGEVSARAASLATKTPDYTSAAGLNTILGKLGVDRAQRMFPSAGQRGKLSAVWSAAQATLGRPLLDFSNAVVLHLTESSVASAVSRLMASPDVEYAEPDWTVATMDVSPTQLPATTVSRAAKAASRLRAAVGTAVGLPDNYALSSSAQSLLNRPGPASTRRHECSHKRSRPEPGADAPSGADRARARLHGTAWRRAHYRHRR
jgi:hypothetical protein